MKKNSGKTSDQIIDNLERANNNSFIKYNRCITNILPELSILRPLHNVCLFSPAQTDKEDYNMAYNVTLSYPPID